MRFAIAACIAMLWALPALAARHAFVIGNANYNALSDLQNTHSDAAAYAAAFEDMGYDVHFFTDLTLDQTEEQFDTFLDALAPGDEVIFVYSGHGWSDGGTNYLIPTDAPKQGRDRQLIRASIALRNGVNGILDEFEAVGVSLAVAIIDACRNNPFQATPGTRSAAIKRGLAPVKAATGTFVIFSAGEGQEALDRLPDDPADQILSVFSRTFIPHLKSGVSLERAISGAQIETAALARTVNGHQQHPAYYDQTLGETCLAGVCKAAVVPNACDALYAEAKELAACFAYEAYAQSCADHLFAPLAEAFIDRNCTRTETAETVPPPVRSLAREDIIKAWSADTRLSQNGLFLPEPPKLWGTLYDDGRHLLVQELTDDETGRPDFRIYDLRAPHAAVFDARRYSDAVERVIWTVTRYFVIWKTGDIDIFDTESDRLVKRLKTRGRLGVRAFVAENPDLLVAFWHFGADEKALAVVDSLTGEVKLETQTRLAWDDYRHVEFSPSNRRIALNAKDPPVKLWDIETGKEILIDPKEHLSRNYLGPVFFSHDDKRLYVSTGFSDEDRFLLEFDIESGEFQRKTQMYAYLWPMPIEAGAGGELLRFGSSGSGYALWNEQDWSRIWTVDIPGDRWKYRTALQPDTGLFASLSPSGELVIYDMYANEELRRENLALDGVINLAFLESRLGLFATTDDGRLFTLNLPD